MAYVADEDGRNRRTECVLCELPERGDDRAALILRRGEEAYVVMNLFPYNNGHLMIIPYAHEAGLDGLPDSTTSEMMRLASDAQRILSARMHPHGFNVGINIGRAGGAGIADHLHMHLVPRWIGDTNFLAPLADTRVLPQHLDETYELLAEEFHS
jgi:ATP adenylyltransferase